MFATGRSGFGNATSGKPDPAKNSCAETDILNVATKIAAIVIRITSLTWRLKFFQFARGWHNTDIGDHSNQHRRC
jgi:hypothetical protein